MIPESEIPGVTALHDHFRLSAAEARVVLLLARRAGGIVSPVEIRDVYADYETTPVIEARSAIKRIRKKIPRTIHIRTHYGEGYSLDGSSLRIVRGILKAAETRAA